MHLNPQLIKNLITEHECPLSSVRHIEAYSHRVIILFLQLIKLVSHAFHHCLVTGLTVKVIHLVGIFLEVVKLPYVDVVVEMDQFITIVTYAVMTLHGMLGGILVVMIVKGVTPVLRPLAFQQGKQGLALDVGWDGGSGQFQKVGA